MKIIFGLLLFFFSANAWATGQRPDILFIEGKKYELYTATSTDSPLETFGQVRDDVFKLYQSGQSGCWRGYTAEWQIDDGQLYLLKVTSCQDGKNLNSLVEKAIKRKFVDGKLRADWVDGVYWGGSGKKYWSAYENEIKVSFKKGALENRKEYTSPNCLYQEGDTLSNLIYSRIDWAGFPNKNGRVSIQFEISNQGQLTQAKVKHSDSPEIEKEALKALKAVPCWKVFTYKGENWGWRDIEIEFSEENRKKYNR